MDTIVKNDPKKGQEFFATNQDPANILRMTDFLADNYLLVDFCWFQIYRFPDFQIHRFPDFQPPPAPPDELSDPNPTTLPRHPGIKYVARALAVICHYMQDAEATFKMFKKTMWDVELESFEASLR